MTLNTTKGTWKINGINLIASDSIAIKLKESIEAGKLEQAYLQKYLGNSLPIIVDTEAKSITFSRF